MMGRAIRLSALGYPAPNPHVGCVIARAGQAVGEGYHDHAGGPHAEVEALQQAGEQARGSTVYVTLEPCNHHGRTPPCSDALIAAGVSRVVVACRDPIGVHSGGIEKLRAAGIEVDEGVFEEEARAANLPWLTAVERGAPFVVAKAAITLDGRIAALDGRSKWITGPEARTEAHRLRAECGAVLVGRRTVESDDPSLTVRHVVVANQPTRVILDPGRKLSMSHRVFDGEAPTLRVVGGAPGDGEIGVPIAEGRLDLALLMKELYARKITGLLVEGGARTIGGFHEAGLIDRLELFVAPKVLGAGKSWFEGSTPESLDQAGFEIVRIGRVGNDAWISCVPRR